MVEATAPKNTEELLEFMGAGKAPTQRLPVRYVLEFLAKQLVDKPEAVRVKELSGDQCITLELTVDEQEIGKIIGRRGRTADALRLLLECVATRDKRRCMLNINQ